MTYPPAHHLLRDLGISGTRAEGEVVNRAAWQPGLADDAGRFRLGVTATVVDMTGAAVALAAVRPDWTATADLNVHSLRPVTGGTINVTCRPVRVGQGRVIIDARVHDDAGECGRGLMAFSRIPGSATSASIEESTGAGVSEFVLDGGTPLDTDRIIDRCGFDPVGPGQLVFAKSDYVANSFGTVNGGVQALAAEVAAVSACGGGHATDLQIHYLEQVGEGPVAVTAEVVRDDGAATMLCSVRTVDRASGQLVATTDVLVAPEP